MTSTTSLKLPDKLKARIKRLAKDMDRSAHAIMVQALEREISREERVRDFVREALAADKAIESGADVYLSDDVHEWMERLARKQNARRPKPWRG